MVFATDDRPEPLDQPAGLPAWLVWLQLGLSTTLAVLFVVMLVKTREQSATLRDLQDRVAGLENGRALDRTTALEEQLRSTAARLQAVERMGARVSGLMADNARLRQEVRLKDGAGGQASGTPPAELAVPPLPPIKPTPAAP